MLTRRRLLALLGTCAVSACARPRPPSSPMGAVAFTGADVFDGAGFGRADVLVADGRIVSVGDDIPAAAQRIDVAGMTLIPGFIDAHVHLSFASPADVLAGGVTTVRDLGSKPGLVAAKRDSSVLRVLQAGQILTPAGGYPSRSWGSDGTAAEVTGDPAPAVRRQVNAGADIIKVAMEPVAGPVFGEAALRAIVTAAHAAGRRVSAHVGDREQLELAIEVGVDELAHLPLFDVTPTQMQAAAGAGMTLVPTLESRSPALGGAPAVAAFLDAGGRVVYGTDLGNTGTAPGIEVMEIQLLAAAGMSVIEVLRSATSGAADYLGLPDVGRLLPTQSPTSSC